MRYIEIERISDRDGVTEYIKYQPAAGNDCWSALVGVVADIACAEQIVLTFTAITSAVFEVTAVHNAAAAKRIAKQFAAYRSVADCQPADSAN